MSILYITQNGITDHIGRSQVAPYVIGLAALGFKIHVLSAEKPGQDILKESYQKTFDDAGIRWTRVQYHRRPKIIGQAFTQGLMYRAAKNIVAEGNVKAVHCRSFPPALIGLQLKRKYGVKFIFDFRDFYVDGGLENSKGLLYLVFHRLKQYESELVQNADKIVCLTSRTREILTSWYLSESKSPEKRFQIIPCCADFKHFDLSLVTQSQLSIARAKSKINVNEFVLLYLGSLGPDYLLEHMIALFKQVQLVRPHARFVFVSNNGSDLVTAECIRQSVEMEKISFVSADRNEIPAYLALADMSVFFYRAGLRSAGCSPTKLAELFACNVPVITNSGVGDMDKIIQLDRNGSIIVNDFDGSSLRFAVEKVITNKSSYDLNIRDNSRDLDLHEGVRRYAEVYKEVLNY